MDTHDLKILSDLRVDLLAGNLSGLEHHLALLAGLEARLGDRHDRADLEDLRVQADRNREILKAAAAGVRAALRRLGEAGAPSAIYAPDGRRVVLGGHKPGIGSCA